MKTTYKQQINAIKKAKERTSLPILKELNDAQSTIAAWAFLEASIKARIKAIKNDRRLYTKQKRISSNLTIPMEFIQIQLITQLNCLEEFIGLPLTPLPL